METTSSLLFFKTGTRNRLRSVLQQLSRNLSVSFTDCICKFKRPLPSCLLPPCPAKRVFVRNHSCDNIFRVRAHFQAKQSRFHLKGFARRLILKQRHKVSEMACSLGQDEYVYPICMNVYFACCKRDCGKLTKFKLTIF